MAASPREPRLLGGDVSGLGDEAVLHGDLPRSWPARRPPGRTVVYASVGPAARATRCRTWDGRRRRQAPDCAPCRELARKVLDCRWRRLRPARENSSFESRRPRVVSTIRSASVTSSSRGERPAEPRRRAAAPRRPAAPRPGAGRGSRLGRRARVVDRPDPPGGGCGGRPSPGTERRDVAVEPGGVPAPRRPVERVGPGPDRLVRQPPPVGEVVAALVAGPGPVRDLVAAPAVGGQADDRVVVLRRGPVLVLLRPRRRAPAPRAGRRRQVVAAGPVRPSASGSSSVSA